MACGKGAVAVKIAQSFGISVYEFDLIPEFIEYAKQKTKQFKVDSLCHFSCGDVNQLVEELSCTEPYDFDSDNRTIAMRANELIAKHPKKQVIFERYIQSQLNKSSDLEDSLVSITWMLQRL